jgi:hypothetical protein
MLFLKRVFLFAIIAITMISACTSSSPQATSPTEQAQVDSESNVTDETSQVAQGSSQTETTIPTDTPTALPTSTSTPSASQKELTEKWRPSIGMFTLLTATCEGAMETANNAIEGELGAGQQLGEMLALGIFVNIIEEGLNQWEPSDNVQEFKELVQGHTNAIKEITGQWSDEEITPSEARDQLDAECTSIEESFKSMVETAQDEGITQASLESIVEDIQNSFDEMDSELTTDEVQDETIPSEQGLSHSNPFPFGEQYATLNWDLQVLEVIRGDQAWQMIQQANQFNDPPQEGMEYILIKMKATSTAEDSEEHSISDRDFNLTGSRLIQYSPASVVEPDPALDAILFAGGETEGWIGFSVGKNEDNLILVFDELANFDENRFRFFALEENASLSIPEELKAIQPTSLGTDRSSPVPLGETVVTEDWEVTVKDVIRGIEAWEMIQEANQFNEPPMDGMQYVLVKFEVRYIGISNTAESIDSASFKSTGSENAIYDAPSVVDPEPRLEADLFPGGIYEGWLTLSAAQDETNLSAIFTPWIDFDNRNRRFLSLE